MSEVKRGGDDVKRGGDDREKKLKDFINKEGLHQEQVYNMNETLLCKLQARQTKPLLPVMKNQLQGLK